MKELCIRFQDRYGQQIDLDYSDMKFFLANDQGHLTIFSKMYGFIGTQLTLRQLYSLLEDHINGQD